MAPKPFPFPLGVGVDICKTRRIAALLRQENTRNQWARRVFTRLEWPALCKRFDRANWVDGKVVESSYQEKTDNNSNMGTKDSGPNDVWMLPELSKHSEVFQDSELFWSTIADGRSKLAVLANYLAGRWAAKEAVIKAHRYRRLQMEEISIVHLPHQDSKSRKTTALIDPVCNRIEMHERVAKLRGLRGFTPQTQGFRNAASPSRGELEEIRQGHERQSSHFNRRRKIKDFERQCAEVNISHDGEYAMAVCVALDSPNMHPEGRRVFDTGSGSPIHEPQWGDRGFFDHDDWSEGEESNYVALEDSLQDHIPSADTETYERAIKELLKETDNQDDWGIPPLPR